MFEKFIAPSMKYADLVVPWGKWAIFHFKVYFKWLAWELMSTIVNVFVWWRTSGLGLCNYSNHCNQVSEPLIKVCVKGRQEGMSHPYKKRIGLGN